MNKVLKINNFGVYYKTKERSLISQAPSDEDRKAFLSTFSNYDESGRTIKQADDYLIIPIRLEVKLTQNDPQTALDAHKTLLHLFVALDKFGITIQKGQYDNVQMLLELTSEYVRFLTTESLRTRRSNLTAMNTLLKEALGHEVGKQDVRELYTQIFKRRMELIATANPKKPEKLQEALDQDLEQAGQKEIY